jgi:DNA-binding XRE family transcriptional regulator
MRVYKVNLKFGNSVQRARKQMDLSQEELADKIGISRNHMGRIERGEVNISLRLASKITKLLKIELN